MPRGPNGYIASPELEETILALAPRYTTEGRIAQSWGALKRWHEYTDNQYLQPVPDVDQIPIAVHQAGTEPEHNIFSCRHVHFAFRAWHDWCHLVRDRGFDTPSEYEVAKFQVSQLRLAGIGSEDRRAIWFFVAGEVEHYWTHKRFIDYKSGFVEYCLIHGLPKALATDWSYIRRDSDRQHAA